MQIRWRQIDGLRIPIRVSSAGDVEQLADGEWSQARYYLSKGRRHVHLYTNGGEKIAKSVSSLVATAFLGRIPRGCVAVHLNGDKTDDRLENLKIMTFQELGHINGLRRHRLVNITFPDDNEPGWNILQGTRYPVRVNEAGEVEVYKEGNWERKNRFTRSESPVEYVCIQDSSGRSSPVAVRNLIYQAYRGEIPAGFQAWPINGDPKDCRLVNLRLASKDEVREASREKHCRPVAKYDRDGNLLRVYRTLTEAGRDSHHSIREIAERAKLPQPKPFRDGTWFAFVQEAPECTE